MVVEWVLRNPVVLRDWEVDVPVLPSEELADCTDWIM